jgi:hypothetical protein
MDTLRTRIAELEIALKLAQADKVTLIAERDRYRDALKKIIEYGGMTGGLHRWVILARTALKEGQDD